MGDVGRFVRLLGKSGVRVSLIVACDCVWQLITSIRKAFSVAVNLEKIHQASNDPALAALINRAQMFILFLDKRRPLNYIVLHEI